MKIGSRYSKKRIILMIVIVAMMIIANLATLSVGWLVILFSSTYVLTIIFFKIILGNTKRLVTAIETIYISIYFLYSIMNPIQFMLDGGGQRSWIVSVNSDLIVATLLLYFNVYCLFVILLLLTGHPKTNTFEDVASKLINQKIKVTLKPNVFDLIAFGCLIIFAYYFVRNIGNLLSFVSFTSLRSDLTFSGQQYIWLYMMAYTLTFMSGIPFQRNYLLKTTNLLRVILVICFWAMSLLIDRRHILPVVVSVALLFLATKRKVSLKSFVPFFVVIATLLSLAVIRLGYTLNSLAFPTLFYTLFGEFILTNYVSCYYIANPPAALLFGSTYIWNTLTRIVPRAIFPGKPEDLALVFYNQAIHTGSGYAFNPIAEGLINFGTFSVISTPLVIFFVMSIGSRLYKKEPLFYLMMCAYSFDFMRGEFPNSMFDIAVLYIFLHFMNKSTLSKSKRA